MAATPAPLCSLATCKMHYSLWICVCVLINGVVEISSWLDQALSSTCQYVPDECTVQNLSKLCITHCTGINADLVVSLQSRMLRFSLALLCLSLLAVAEDEKAPSSITLDDKTFKEKVEKTTFLCIRCYDDNYPSLTLTSRWKLAQRLWCSMLLGMSIILSKRVMSNGS